MVRNEVYSLPLDAYLYKNLNIEISITVASYPIWKQKLSFLINKLFNKLKTNEI